MRTTLLQHVEADQPIIVSDGMQTLEALQRRGLIAFSEYRTRSKTSSMTERGREVAAIILAHEAEGAVRLGMQREAA